PPAGLVAVSGGAIGQHFGWRFVFITVIERADGGCGGRHRMPDKIAGAFGAIGGYNDPSPCDGVLTQFGQVEGFLRSSEQRSAILDYIVVEPERWVYDDDAAISHRLGGTYATTASVSSAVK